MKSILKILNNLRNLTPYFLLIATYFFFVNLEARKESKKDLLRENDLIKLSEDKSSSIKKQLRLAIPVIPYKN